MKKLLVAGLLASFATSGAMASVIYSQSFENDDWLGGKYYDYGDSSTDHWLVNNAGEAAVNGDGFNAWYESTGGVGLTDGDYVGVTDYTGNTGGMYDGNNAYQMSDTDGIMSLFFDDFGSGVNVSLAIFIASTGYEDADSLTVSYGSDVLLQLGGNEDDGVALENAAGTWIILDASNVSGQLSISFNSNSGSEAVFIDAVSISAIPAPGALALIGIAGLARRRRR
ncbi:MAG: hypothetical protein QF718_06625 [Phycisphaerales bacterium]|jgi:hypothetical protein|nr:hypothetical protein [Phycisphaerales bacterium]